MSALHDTGALEDLCRKAARRAGASPHTARTLASATMEAESRGRTAVGLGHFFDYLDGLRQGRIDGAVRPRVQQVTAGVITADCGGGLAQSAFEDSYDALVLSARSQGLAMVSVVNAFTCGELGFYARRLARSGLIAVAAANTPALVSIGGARGPVVGTNPLAYGFPRSSGPPVLVDQASSQTAYVNVRTAAGHGTAIPEGWAIDGTGAPTTDPTAALTGALLPFGAYKGGNIALLIEMLAVLSGANWSMDAPPFDHGSRSPGIGMFVLAIEPKVLDPDYATRLDDYIARLADDWSIDVSRIEDPTPTTRCRVEPRLFERLERAATSGTPCQVSAT